MSLQGFCPSAERRERTHGKLTSRVNEVLRTPGQPLAQTVRAVMESRFSHDFSPVRVHTDSRAAESAEDLNAKAYTIGKHVVFGKGRYNTQTKEGDNLLAHELVHVIQQDGAETSTKATFILNQTGDRLEQEADKVAVASIHSGYRNSFLDQVVNRNTIALPIIQRKCKRSPRQGSNEIISSQKNDYDDAVKKGKYCKDTSFTGLFHKDKICYREVPPRHGYFHCPPGDQVCFDRKTKTGCVTSYDKVSPVEHKNSDGSCNLHFLCGMTHFMTELPWIVPWLFGSPGKGALAGGSAGLLLGAALGGTLGGGLGAFLIGAGVGGLLGAGIGALIGWLRGKKKKS